MPPSRFAVARRAPWRAAGALLLAAGVLAGCASVPDAAPADEPTTPGEAAASGGAATSADPTTSEASPEVTPAAYPLILDNCGVEVRVEAPPQRIVAIKSSAIEMVLALGAGDRIVGTGYPDGPVPEQWADGAADLPLLSDRVPSAEVVLETEPDLVYAGWESNLAADGAGERAMLAEVGVATYVSPSACKDPAHQPDPLTFETVFAEITEAGDLLGEPEAAAALVADQREQLAAVVPDDRGLRALWWSSGTDTPYVGAGIGAPQMLMAAAGLVNVAGSVHDTWTSLSWEQIAADDPDVIVLVDSEWNSAEKKMAYLAEHPVASNLTAVRAGSYVVVPFAGTEAGVRNVATAAALAADVAALGR